MEFQCFYPSDTWVVTQAWGVSRPEIYSQFGFTRHNGTDVLLAPNKLIRAPFDGKVVKIGYQPNGGGIYFGIMSNDTFTFPDGVTCNVLWDCLHLDHTLCVEGASYLVGDILAVADNTGLSTGPHTHHQVRREYLTRGTWQDVDKNDANNTFDPTPYFRGYAKDYASIRTGIANAAKQVAIISKQVADLVANKKTYV